MIYNICICPASQPSHLERGSSLVNLSSGCPKISQLSILILHLIFITGAREQIKQDRRTFECTSFCPGCAPVIKHSALRNGPSWRKSLKYFLWVLYFRMVIASDNTWGSVSQFCYREERQASLLSTFPVFTLTLLLCPFTHSFIPEIFIECPSIQLWATTGSKIDLVPAPWNLTFYLDTAGTKKVNKTEIVSIMAQ